MAISSISPHKALFISEKIKGGVHDMSIYKSRTSIYKRYLKVKSTERQSSPLLANRNYYDLIADRGNFGLKLSIF